MGLFEFVFGKGAPKDDSQGNAAYYLSDDDAKSFGDIEYMRSVKTVRRTFAKQKGQTEHMESVRQISATQMSSVDEGNNSFAAPKASTPTASSSVSSTPTASSSVSSTPTPAPAPVTPRRSAASSNDMDMFRNMAKKIKK